MTVEAVCFDLDDTLFDYHEYARAGLRSAADQLETATGERLHDELESLYFREGVTDGTFDVLLDRHDLSPELTPRLVEAYHDATTTLSPYPDTEAVLSELSATHDLGLITDGRGGHGKLRRLGIRGYFDAVLVTPTVDASKRDPAVFRTVLSELSVAPGDAMYVGDDPRFDIDVPATLGMTTVRVRRGRYADREPPDGTAPDHEIDSLGELTSIVG